MNREGPFPAKHMPVAPGLALTEAPRLWKDVDKPGERITEWKWCREGHAVQTKGLAPGPKLSFLLPSWCWVSSPVTPGLGFFTFKKRNFILIIYQPFSYCLHFQPHTPRVGLLLFFHTMYWLLIYCRTYSFFCLLIFIWLFLLKY